MADLMSVYNQMNKEANTQAEEQEASPEAEIFQKYASVAEGALSDEYGEDFTAEDVEKLADLMIQHDVEQEVMQEKVAEYAQAGTIMARAFKAELETE